MVNAALRAAAARAGGGVEESGLLWKRDLEGLQTGNPELSLILKLYTHTSYMCDNIKILKSHAI